MPAETLETLRLGIEVVLPIACAVLGWLLNNLFRKFEKIDEEMREMSESFSNFRTDMPLNYIRKEDYRDSRAQDQKVVDAVFQTLRRIEDRVEKMAEQLTDRINEKADKR